MAGMLFMEELEAGVYPDMSVVCKTPCHVVHGGVGGWRVPRYSDMSFVHQIPCIGM